MRRSLLALSSLLLIAATAGGAQRYAIDSGASSVSAKVPFFGLASKTASFPKVSGEASILASDPRALSLDVTIDARALEAPDETTRSRLRGPKFFWVDKYPTVHFAGQGMTMRDARSGSINGSLTARGASRPVTLAVTFAKAPAEARSGEAIALTATTTINRRDFGMTSYPLIVGRKVDITIKARMVPS